MYTALYQTTTNLQQLFFFFFHLATFFLEKGYQPLVTLARRQNQGPRCCIDSRRLSKKKKNILDVTHSCNHNCKQNKRKTTQVCTCLTSMCIMSYTTVHKQAKKKLSQSILLFKKTTMFQGQDGQPLASGFFDRQHARVRRGYRYTLQSYSKVLEFKGQLGSQQSTYGKRRPTYEKGKKKIYKPDCIFTACQKKAKNSSTVPRTATSLMHTSGTRKLLNTDATEGNKYKFNLAYNTWENEAAVYILSIKMTF